MQFQNRENYENVAHSLIMLVTHVGFKNILIQYIVLQKIV